MSNREIPPPATMSVFHDHRPVLYRADGTALVRVAGFAPAERRNALQTTGTFPQLTRKGLPKLPKPKPKGK